MKTDEQKPSTVLDCAVAFAGSCFKQLMTPLGTIAAGVIVNQAGATALGQVTVYEDGEYEVGELGDTPRHRKPVLTQFQIAAYPQNASDQPT